MLNLFESFGFDLADALTGDTEFLAYFFEGVGNAITETKTHFENLLFARSQTLDGFLHVVAQNLEAGGAVGRNILYVFDKVAQLGILVVIANWHLERHGILRNFDNMMNF